MNSAKICAVITEQTTESARQAMRDAATRADMIELRLDFLRDFDFTRPERLASLLCDNQLPAIITCRAAEEGGMQRIDDRVRLRLLVEGARAAADYCDIEAAHYDRALEFSPDPARLIVSYHNFEETPRDLNDVYDRVCARAAAVHKIAAKANSISDALAMFGLLDRARREGRNLIALSMGEPGLITRLLGPGFGGFLTYAALSRGRESAPGQIDCEEMTGLYRVQHVSRDTRITGIIGNPVAHSASPAMHNRAFAALGLDYLYLPLSVSDVSEFFSRFVRAATREMEWRLRGLSVTFPHKVAVLPLLDEIDSTAREIGAVNTIVIGERIKGYNTDVEGAIAPLERRCSIEGEHCAVIGAGGAARAVVYGLKRRGAHVTLFARDEAKAAVLADQFSVALRPLDALESSEAQIIINTTPVGMRGHSEGASVVARRLLSGRKIAYDLVYNPSETQFLKDAQGEGCLTIGGLEMLVAQAAIQFELWTGQRAPVELMHSAAVDRLGR